MCVPGPDELVGIHLATGVGDAGRMVTDFMCGRILARLPWN